jgi:predicted ATPase
MPARGNRLFVHTGGQEFGKSTFLDVLVQAVCSCSGDTGKHFQQPVQLDRHGLTVARTCSQNRASTLRGDAVELCSTGAPGATALRSRYSRHIRVVDLPAPGPVTKTVEMNRYDQRVFIAPPCLDIYHEIGERRQLYGASGRC